ncbi:unnamed protein product [Macrosiphum euphorbiae]|uniref:Nuclear transcription factor Y subunit gamma n=1 Tax=Macrosiphum euphorbiae TaxID=13131 RepID=A0AAV0X0Z0_9HEMI|nr:unnamed protein product [Macrosiphum euphorbiae]
MSFLVNPSTEEEEEDNLTEDEPNATTISVDDKNQTFNLAALNQFWPKAIEEIRKIGTLDLLKPQALPLTRIKKVMKLDDNVKMVSAEAPMLFSKAVEIFINELTLWAWTHTEHNRRSTLQRNDVAMAITKYDQFHFLIDIVPREEAKIVPKQVKTSLNPEQIPNNTSNITSTSTTVTGSQPQVIQLQGNTQALNTNSNSVLQLIQQVITPTGEIQHIPLQINFHQLQMLHMQIQNYPQFQQVQVVQSQPQIIQVASQANEPTPVYISQPTINPSSSPE